MLKIASVLFLFVAINSWADVLHISFGYYRGGVLHTPPADILKQFAECGIQTDLGSPGTFITIEQLKCPGLLDYRKSHELRDRVLKLIERAPAKIRNAVSRVRFAISPYALFKSSQVLDQEVRRFAINIPSLRLVILNEIYWNLASPDDAGRMLLTHEALLAAGFDDTDFSPTLNILGYEKKTKFVVKKLRFSGGGSVIGHGGDPTEMLFKAGLYAYLEQQSKNAFQNSLVKKKDVIRALQRARVQTVPVENLLKTQACLNIYTNQQDAKTCGGYLWKKGNPSLIMPSNYNDLTLKSEQSALLANVLSQVVEVLQCLKQDGCKELQ